ncbi:carboxymuconolactone decarboxylase family protein [Streptomyces sp. 2P-4]|uniref:carboxymuconolactone decarboxylase family protein n=1 Tax=Streptomyces sp. 2P-4 TaxID=2931974 RepID=UPI0025417A3A|nr:carboxymuconolactone decarboxylase family protein [Streptomyces sp. 2P-4]
MNHRTGLDLLPVRRLVRTALRGALARTRYVAVVRPEHAEGTVAAVYTQAERDFGVLAPPIALHAAAPDILAAAWALLRETLLVPGRVDRAAREAVAAAVSEANACPYCVEVHGAMVRTMAGRQGPPGGPGAAGQDGRIGRWVRGSGGGPPAGPPGTPEELPEYAGVAVAFHYLNRMVSVFLDDSPLPAATPAAARGTVMRMVTEAMRPRDPAGPLPGAALELLPAAPLPADLAWAAGSPSVAGAFARAAAAVEAGGARALSPDARELVRARLAAADGTAPGPSRAWALAAVRDLPAADRPAARLALLTGLAAYQVVPDDITEFRAAADPADDRALIELTAWAALTAARLAGRRLTRSATGEKTPRSP